ncbi:MAG: hypothetical protein NVSMB3_00230 [Acidobacteriaceae bacterium]
MTRSGELRVTPSLLRLTLALASLTLLAAILLRFPPSATTFYPQCPIYTLLHLQCPGCGTTRALAALLRGHLLEGLRLNPLTTCTLPVAALVFLWRTLRSCLGAPLPAPLPAPEISPSTLFLSLAGLALFTVLRNL